MRVGDAVRDEALDEARVAIQIARRGQATMPTALTTARGRHHHQSPPPRADKARRGLTADYANP